MKIEQLFEKININPKNKNIYIQAFTHKTFTNENKKFPSYEKLEFIGDSILQFTSSYYIFNEFKDIDEGTMSNLRAKNVSTKALSSITKNNKFNEFLIYSNNDSLKDNEKICSDIFESLVAAIYIDLGMGEVMKFLNKYLFPNIKNTNINDENLKDPKSRLQEKLQPFFKKPIVYNTLNVNHKEWRSEAICDNITYGIGVGKTKNDAEISAALNALKKYKI